MTPTPLVREVWGAILWQIGLTVANGSPPPATLFEAVFPKRAHKPSKSNRSLHSPYFAQACNEWRDPSPRLSAWATQLPRNIAAAVSPWRHCPIGPAWESNLKHPVQTATPKQAIACCYMLPAAKTTSAMTSHSSFSQSNRFTRNLSENTIFTKNNCNVHATCFYMNQISSVRE